MNVWSKVLTQVGELEMAIDCVKTGGGSDSERKEEEQEEMKLGVMSFKRIEKEAVSVTSGESTPARKGERWSVFLMCVLLPAPLFLLLHHSTLH